MEMKPGLPVTTVRVMALVLAVRCVAIRWRSGMILRPTRNLRAIAKDRDGAGSGSFARRTPSTISHRRISRGSTPGTTTLRGIHRAVGERERAGNIAGDDAG